MTDDIEVTGIDDNPAPPAAVQVDPQALAAIVAAEVGKSVRGLIPQPQPVYQPPQPQPGYLDAWRNNQIQNGADQRQLDELILMVEARERDKEIENRQRAQQNAAAQFHHAFWSTMEEVFDDLAEKMPALRKAKVGIFDDAYQLLVKGDTRFADIGNHVNSGAKLTRNQASRLLAHVSDEYLKSIGAVRTEAPVSTKGSAPTQAGRTAGSDKPVFLDADQETFYRQFRGELGDEAARELARQYKQD